MRWGGAGVKLPAARRAVQALGAHVPGDAAIIFADGADTAIANAPTREAIALLAEVAARTDRDGADKEGNE